MSLVASVLPSLTTITSKSDVRRPATCTARMTRLAIVPPSLYAGKKMLSPGGRGTRESAIGDDKPYHGNTLRARKAVEPRLDPAYQRGRAASRHGRIADSMITAHESFDAPSRRSTKVIGTSAHRKPARDASQASSTMSAYPSERIEASGSRSRASRRQHRKPLVQSRMVIRVVGRI